MSKRDKSTYSTFEKRFQYDRSDKEYRLGKGGYGTVYKAWDSHFNRWVAIKESRVDLETDIISVQKETELVLELPTHPNIANYEECYRFQLPHGIFDFAILQYYKEGNLSDLIKKGSLSIEQIQLILMGLLDGMQFLHDNGIIHRDLKPGNILIIKGGDYYIPKITDFGISKITDMDRTLYTNSMKGIGTLVYSSPEQIENETIGKNSDLWSFGVIAFYLFTGYLPFSKSSSDAISLANVIGGILPPSIESIPEPWQALIKECLNPNPEKRIKSCDDCKKMIPSDILSANASLNEKVICYALCEEEATRPMPGRDLDEKLVRKLLLAWVILFLSFISFIAYAISNHSPNDAMDIAISPIANESIGILAEVELKAGMSLRNLAMTYYGENIYWVYIYEENKDKIPHINEIPIGINLLIPNLSKYGVLDLESSVAIKKAEEKEHQIFLENGKIK